MADPTPAASSMAVEIPVLGIKRGELAAVAWSFAYFFCLLSAYYMLRPVRDAMAIVGGEPNIKWLFTGTFVAMVLATPLFGWLTSRFPRRVFLPWVYYFFVANMLIFYAAFTYTEGAGIDQVWISRAFFVWLSVFNLFVVSVFWSFMADIYSKEQSRRLFGVISAGGSTGALIGPIVTGHLVTRIGFENLLPLSAILLLVAVYCVYRLRDWVKQRVDDGSANTEPRLIGGSAMEGIRLTMSTPYFRAIAVMLVCANFLGVFVYVYMAEIVSHTFDNTNERTQVFAWIDAAINALSFIGQLILVKHAVRKFGVGATLAILPVVSLIGLLLLAIHPVFAVMAGIQILRRSITFGFAKPTSDMLYSVVPKNAKYKVKNFIETAIYRGGDLAGVWLIGSLGAFSISAVALAWTPFAAIFAALAIWVGKEYNQRDAELTLQETE